MSRLMQGALIISKPGGKFIHLPGREFFKFCGKSLQNGCHEGQYDPVMQVMQRAGCLAAGAVANTVNAPMRRLIMVRSLCR